MSNSPTVKFNLINNNVDISTPMAGVSTVLARTTRGPQNDPSILITSVSQFNRVYGNEIVPDGSASNIEKALIGGSKLRVIRVQASDATKGSMGINLNFKIGSSSPKSIKVNFVTRNKGDVYDINKASVTISTVGNNTKVLNLSYMKDTEVISKTSIMSYQSADDVNKLNIDYLTLNNFFNSDPYFEPALVSSDVEEITSISGLIDYLSKLDGTNESFEVEVTPTSGSINWGTAGGAATANDWIDALEYVKDYNDSYQVFCSHLNQHLTTDYIQVYQKAKTIADELEEWVFYIEVPKSENNVTKMVAWLKNTMGTVGNSKFVAYFGGGIKYYNKLGVLTDSDVLGTVVGLGDASASAYGPYRSFAGMNRGLIPDGNGSVCPNYGASSRYEDLNTLANNYINMIVVKDTRTSGKLTMLWHCFSSQVKQDSFRFLTTVRLCLYIKKQLRPILESYIEEPNIWSTWNRIYLEGKAIMDDLVTNDAISEYTWNGDQNATAWSDLVVNTEQEARQGKYKLKINMKDIVTMQDISVDLIIDASSKTVTANMSE